MSINSIEKLVCLIVQKAAQIIEQLDEIALRNFPSENPQKLIKVIKNTCTTLSEHALKRGQELVLGENESAENELKLMMYCIADMANDIRYIESASIERTPWNLVQPFEKLSSQIDETIPIILCPEWEYNFHIVRNLINGYRKSVENILNEKQIEEIFNEIPDEIYVISFPGFEKSNILLQSILGHELGHPLATKFLSKESAAYISDLRDEVEKIEKELIQELNPVKKEYLKSQLVTLIKIIRNNGLSEIISDLIAVRLFGFAAIFSAFDFSVMFSLDKEPEHKYYYPPWRYRIREMLAELEWTDIKDEMKKAMEKNSDFKAIYNSVEDCMQKLDKTVAIKTDMEKISSSPVLKIAYDSIAKSLPTVKIFLRDELKKFPPMKESVEDIFYLCQRITCSLPPNAIENPSPFNAKIPSIREIINAGWFYKLTFIPTKLSVENYKEYLAEIDLLNRLIFKALELSDVCSLYSQYNSRKD